MEDEAFVEFDAEEIEKELPKEQTSWSMLARYCANFKPNTKAMFDHFINDVWRI
jgi:hypothetical protein